MADNYLEKKMEEHRANASSNRRATKLSPAGNRPGTVALKIEPLRVLVTDADSFAGSEIAKRLCEAGCKVAFISADLKQGRHLSQATGSRFYPSVSLRSALTDMNVVWGGTDVLVVTGDSPALELEVASLKRIIIVGTSISILPKREGVSINAVDITDKTPSQTALLVLLLCLHETSFITGKILK